MLTDVNKSGGSVAVPSLVYTVESADSADRSRADLRVEDPDPEVAVAVLEGASPPEIKSDAPQNH